MNVKKLYHGAMDLLNATSSENKVTLII